MGLEEDEVNSKDTLLKEETVERNIVLEKQTEKVTEKDDSVKDIQVEKLPVVTEEEDLVKDIQIEKLPYVTKENDKINVQNKEGVVGKKRVEDMQLDDVKNKVSAK